MARLDVDEIGVLKGILEHKSIEEIGVDIGKSIGWVHHLMEDLEEVGYVVQTKPRGARTREVTTAGRQYLQANGLLPINVTDIFKM
ncbi:MAG: hypothetical protein LUO89_11305 [Methanothrix sp.]|nr:hypothetical protein [Methanothrix sp.]